jgi:hypothetical protein
MRKINIVFCKIVSETNRSFLGSLASREIRPMMQLYAHLGDIGVGDIPEVCSGPIEFRPILKPGLGWNCIKIVHISTLSNFKQYSPEEIRYTQDK